MKSWLVYFLLLATTQATAQRYIIFLHNAFVEEHGPSATHPEYGVVEYEKILNYFKAAGFRVLSEIRPAGTDANTYAEKVARQADSLLHLGVLPSHICIVGTSKGGYIAMKTSALLKNRAINYVSVGNCSAGKKTVLYGNLLVIREKSDAITANCTPDLVSSTCCLQEYKEIELNTGLKHGFLFKATDDWLLPCCNWANSH